MKNTLHIFKNREEAKKAFNLCKCYPITGYTFDSTRSYIEDTVNNVRMHFISAAACTPRFYEGMLFESIEGLHYINDRYTLIRLKSRIKSLTLIDGERTNEI